MSLVEFSEEELNRLLKNCTDSESLHAQMQVNRDILDVVKTFSSQGHTGFSAQYCLNILNRLLNYKPLSAITDNADEWEALEYGEDIAYQCKRCPQVFKDAEGRVYDVEGKVFSDNNGHSWFTNAESRVYVELPYSVPEKPEYVIIDNKEERLQIQYHIVDRIGYLGAHIVDTDINEDVVLLDILDKDRFKDLENILIEDYHITKPLFEFDDDTELWNVIDFVMKSDKENDEQEEIDIAEVNDEEVVEETDEVEEITEEDESEEETE